MAGMQVGPVPGSGPPLFWEGDRMLHIYMWDYCQKRKFHQAAQAFISEAGVSPDQQVPIDAPQGLLYEWWTVFWDIFTARSMDPGTWSIRKSDAHAYVHHQESNRLRMLMGQHEQHRQIAVQAAAATHNRSHQPTWPPSQSVFRPRHVSAAAGPSSLPPPPPTIQRPLPAHQHHQPPPSHLQYPHQAQQMLPQGGPQQAAASGGPAGPGALAPHGVRSLSESFRQGSPLGNSNTGLPSGLPDGLTAESRPSSRLAHGSTGAGDEQQQQPQQQAPSDAGRQQPAQGPNHELSSLLGLQRPASTLLIQQCMHMMGFGGRRFESLGIDERTSLGNRIRRIQMAQSEAQVRMAQLHGLQGPGARPPSAQSGESNALDLAGPQAQPAGRPPLRDVVDVQSQSGTDPGMMAAGAKRKEPPNQHLQAHRGPPGMNRPNDPAAQMLELEEQQQLARRLQQQSALQQQLDRQRMQQQQLQQLQQQQLQQQQAGQAPKGPAASATGPTSAPMRAQWSSQSAQAFNTAAGHAQSQISQQIQSLQQSQMGQGTVADASSNLAQIQQLRRLQGRMSQQGGPNPFPQGGAGGGGMVNGPGQGHEGMQQGATNMGPPPSPSQGPGQNLWMSASPANGFTPTGASPGLPLNHFGQHLNQQQQQQQRGPNINGNGTFGMAAGVGGPGQGSASSLPASPQRPGGMQQHTPNPGLMPNGHDHGHGSGNGNSNGNDMFGMHHSHQQQPQRTSSASGFSGPPPGAETGFDFNTFLTGIGADGVGLSMAGNGLGGGGGGTGGGISGTG